MVVFHLPTKREDIPKSNTFGISSLWIVLSILTKTVSEIIRQQL